MVSLNVNLKNGARILSPKEISRPGKKYFAPACHQKGQKLSWRKV